MIADKQLKHPLARKRKMTIIILPILLMIASIGSLMIGQVSFSVGEVLKSIFIDDDSLARRIVWEIRVPRILLGVIVGMCLAIAGAILQAIMQNPLADPGVIGVTSGAGVMAILVMIVFPGYIFYLPIASFLGAFIAAMVVYTLAFKRGGTSPMRIILVGIAVNAIAGAGTNAMMILYSDRVQAVLPWLSGGLMGVGWTHLNNIWIYAVMALLLALYSIKHIRIMRLGDEMAKLLGHHVERSRFVLIIISTLLAGIAVSVAGLVGFVGLVVPHILRLIIGGEYKYLLPASAVGGALLVVVADSIARSVFNPTEIPVGILLAFIGGPYFLYLIHRKGNFGATS